jgi:antitoxin ParD1/3/4
MTITLNPDQEARLKTRVASGDFASVEEAARQLIDEALAERALEESDDMAWAKPYVDEALAEVERGEVITLEEHEARNDARLAAMR